MPELGANQSQTVRPGAASATAYRARAADVGVHVPPPPRALPKAPSQHGGVGSLALAYFQSKGLSRAAAAGIVGNMQQESSLDPNAPGGGLIQGQGGRTSSGTAQQQLDGVWHELTTSEAGTLAKLKSAATPEQAARIFSEDFERPGDPMLGNRERYAAEAFGGTFHEGSVSRETAGSHTGTLASLGLATQQTPRQRGMQLLAAEDATREGNSPLVRDLEAKAKPTATATAPATAVGLPGMPSVSTTGAAPNVKLPSAAPAPSVAAVQGLTPALPKAVAQAKAALEHADHHPVGIPELTREVDAGPEGRHAEVVAETPGGKVVKTPGGPVYLPKRKNSLEQITGQREP
jgi:hypothetical protein